MKIPLSWIKEYIQLDLSPEEIAKALTMAGMEVESVEPVALNFSGLVVGRVLEAEKHPNADKLTLASVTDGKEVFQVVCGAPNCRKGLKTAFAPIGSVFKEEDGKNFVIKKTKIRGIESSGMLCSGKELNLSEDADGIIELPKHLTEGTLLADLYSDAILDISLTPNLSHCSSVFGIVRELSAITGIPMTYPQFNLTEGESPIGDLIDLKILDTHACPKYACRVIKGVKIGPSPDWLRTKLEKSGLRSINNVVDVTNFVLLEMGHPLHAFDYDLIEGKQIIVRKAEEGSLFTTLDGKERILSQNDLVICDARHPIALAGIMGGGNSEVSDRTCNVLLESAYFDPLTIRKTSKRLGLQTDSSKRFERGTDPNNLINSMDRAAMLIAQVSGGQVSKGFLEVFEQEFPEKIIHCRLGRINQLLGLHLTQGEVESIFRRLNFHCSWDGQDTLVVQVPTYRVDVQIEVDLIEEVARLYGYNNIPRQGAGYQSSLLPHAPMYLLEKEVQARLIGEGLQEFLTCDLIGPSLLNTVQDHAIPEESVVRVLNPTSVEQSILRTSLMPGLLQVVKYNFDRQNRHIAGFEIGRVHFKEHSQYVEQSVFGVILSGQSQVSHWDRKASDYDFFDMKGIIENLLGQMGIEGVEFKNLKLETFHTGRQASVFVGSLDLGSFGEVHPAIQRRLDIPQRLLFAEFNLHDMIQVIKQTEKIKPLAIYPCSERDWTVTIKKDFPFALLLRYLEQEKSPLLEGVSLVGIYRNEKLGKDFQNMTLHFVYRDPNKTIAQETVEAEHNRLITAVMKRLGDAVSPCAV